MDADSLVTLLLSIQSTLWILSFVNAREQFSTTRRLSTGYAAAQEFVCILLVVWASKTEVLDRQHCLLQATLFPVTEVCSLCKALVQVGARKCRRLCHHSVQAAQENDFQMSRTGKLILYTPPSNPPRLITMPAEIREIIVRMSVAHYDVLDCRPTIILRSRKQFRDAMALIRTCRLLYQEGHRIVISCTLFHIWTRHPFYRPLKSNLRKEITMIHLAAQLSSQHTSKIATAIRDLDDMPSLRDIYLSIWDFIDFTNNSDAVTRVFGTLRRRLKNLCLVQVNLICPRTMNQTAERDLKSLIMTASRSWPTNKEFGILRSLQGPVTKWRAFIRLSGYRTMRTVGADEDLVAVPWDGEHL